MRKNKKSCSISEFCRNNNFRTLEFYKMLSRHPELARKMKANSAGERVLDEEAMMTARAILRKENRAKQGRSSASSAADEINILAAKNEVLRNEMSNLIFCQALTPCIALTALQGVIICHYFRTNPNFFHQAHAAAFPSQTALQEWH